MNWLSCIQDKRGSVHHLRLPLFFLLLYSQHRRRRPVHDWSLRASKSLNDILPESSKPACLTDKPIQGFASCHDIIPVHGFRTNESAARTKCSMTSSEEGDSRACVHPHRGLRCNCRPRSRVLNAVGPPSEKNRQVSRTRVTSADTVSEAQVTDKVAKSLFC